MEVMWTVILLCVLLDIVRAGTCINYEFANNFGQKFIDISGNSRDAVNGDSHLTSTYDTKATDRGAYFDASGQDKITLPPNSIASSNFLLTSTFSIGIWVMVTGANSGIIFYRTKSDNNFSFNIFRNSNGKISLNIYINVGIPVSVSFDGNNQFALSKLYLDSWNFVLMKLLSNKNFYLFLNLNQEISYSLSILSYSESGTFYGTIGSQHSTTAFTGFLWSLNIYDAGVSASSFVGANYIPGNCLVNTCPASCNPSILVNSASYCISTNIDPTQDGAGNSCTSCTNGCSGSICLDCLCTLFSCEIASSQAVCTCESDAIGTATVCQCPDGSAYNPPCPVVVCFEECTTCTTSTHCTACVASNATPNSGSGCSCNEGFWGTSPLNAVSSCTPCYSECKSCTEDLKCTDCKADNAGIDTIQGCICNEGYWSDSLLENVDSCIPCNSDCETCTQDLICDTCKAIKAIPSISQGCICINGYWGNSPLTTCTACNSQCGTCIEDIKCTACVADNAEPSLTGCMCASGFFQSGDLSSQNACTACNFQCLTCTNSISCSWCIDKNAKLDPNGFCQCKTGYYQSLNGNCEQCSPDCKTCIDPNKCIDCVNSAFTVSKNGICACPDGYFVSGNSCEKCLDSCKTCENSVSCLSCVVDGANPNNKKGCDCPENSNADESKCTCRLGYYLDFATGKYVCNQCIAPCQYCINSSVCEICWNSLKVDEKGQCTICPESTYFENDYCFNCKSLCKSCTKTECTECMENAKNTTNCECIQGYTKHSNECMRNYFTASINLSPKNELTLSFSKTLTSTLSTNDFSITIPSISFTFDFLKISTNAYKVKLSFTESVAEKTLLTLFITNSSLTTDDFSQCKNSKLSVKLHKYNYLNTGELIKTMVNSTSTILQASISFSATSGLLSNPSTTWIFINSIQFISYLPLNSNPLTPNLQSMFKSMGSINLFPNPAKVFINELYEGEAYLEAREYGFSTNSFIYNSAFFLLNLFVIVLVFPFIYLVSRLELKWISNKSKELVNDYKYSVFIRFWIQGYLDFGIFAMVQLVSVIYKQTKYSYWIAYLNCIFAGLTIGAILLSGPVVLCGAYVGWHRIHEEEYREKWGSLFMEFKNDKGFVSSQYYFVFLSRRLVFMVSQVMLDKYLLEQACINVFFSLVQVGFLLVYRPFNEKIVFVSSLLAEVCILTVYGLTTAILFDTENIHGTLSYIEIITVCTIYTNIFAQLFISAIPIFISVKNLIKRLFSKKNTKIIPISPSSTRYPTFPTKENPFFKKV